MRLADHFRNWQIARRVPGEPQVPHTGVASVSSVQSPDYLRYFATKRTRAQIKKLYEKVHNVVDAIGWKDMSPLQKKQKYLLGSLPTTL